MKASTYLTCISMLIKVHLIYIVVYVFEKQKQGHFKTFVFLSA